MKKTLACIFFFSISAFADPPGIVKAPKGVEAIHRELYIAHTENGTDFVKWYEEISLFDPEGRIISFSTKYPEGDEGWAVPVEEKFLYKVDDKGRVTERVHLYNKTREDVWKFTYQGDDSYSVDIFLCDIDGAIDEEFPYETWYMNGKEKILSMKAYDK
jgi:hypothetical protein